ncbi:MAG: T9SS type A sorting domain-containing protein [Candidatus Kapaibacterium sp.]|nr:T9SS type A sorting domain-containing protein [Bacteroidota bacterium]
MVGEKPIIDCEYHTPDYQNTFGSNPPAVWFKQDPNNPSCYSACFKINACGGSPVSGLNLNLDDDCFKKSRNQMTIQTRYEGSPWTAPTSFVPADLQPAPVTLPSIIPPCSSATVQVKLCNFPWECSARFFNISISLINPEGIPCEQVERVYADFLPINDVQSSSVDENQNYVDLKCSSESKTYTITNHSNSQQSCDIKVYSISGSIVEHAETVINSHETKTNTLQIITPGVYIIKLYNSGILSYQLVYIRED